MEELNLGIIAKWMEKNDITSITQDGNFVYTTTFDEDGEPVEDFALM